MRVGIFHTDSGRSKEHLAVFGKILEFNEIPWDYVYFSKYYFDRIKEYDYYIHRFIGTDKDRYMANTLLPIVENTLQKPCYPDSHTYWSYEDKIKEYLLMQANGFPMVDGHIFFDEKEALEWAEGCDLPLVFKLSSGAGSSNVTLVKGRSGVRKIIRRMFGRGMSDAGVPGLSNLKFYNYKSFIKHTGIRILTRAGYYKTWPMWVKHKNYVYFQDFLPGNAYDTRITTIGDRAFGFRRMNRKNDFRSSGSGLISYDIKEIDLNCVKIALEISGKMHFQTMAYDFLYDKDGNPVFCEFSYTFNDKALFACPGYWDKDLNFHEGNYWPQYLVLKDIIKSINLVQPVII